MGAGSSCDRVCWPQFASVIRLNAEREREREGMQASGGMTPVCPRRCTHMHTHARARQRKKNLFLARSFGWQSERLEKLGAGWHHPSLPKSTEKQLIPIDPLPSRLCFFIDLPCRPETRPGNDPITRSSLHLSAGRAFVARDAAYCSTFIKEWGGNKLTGWFWPCCTQNQTWVCLTYNSCSTMHTQTHTDTLALHSHTQACQADIPLLN